MSMPPAQGVEFARRQRASTKSTSTPGDGFCVSSIGGCTLAGGGDRGQCTGGCRYDTASRDDPRSKPDPVGAGEDGSLTGDLDILDDLTITGDGMAVSGAEASSLSDRALHVHPGVMLDLSGVSFFWADAGAGQNGGGILNEGTVSMVETTFQFSRAHNGAGVMNVGDMALVRSVVGYNTAADAGGGIRNDGTLTIEQSTIANNEVTAGPGGGIENHGILIDPQLDHLPESRHKPRGGPLQRLRSTRPRSITGLSLPTPSWPDEAGSSGTGGIFNEDFRVRSPSATPSSPSTPSDRPTPRPTAWGRSSQPGTTSSGASPIAP